MLPLLSPSHLRIVQSFPGSSAGKESACNTEDLRSIPGLGRSPGEGKGYPLQYSGLENPVDCWVHGVTQSRHDWPTLLSQSYNLCSHCSLLHCFKRYSELYWPDSRTPKKQSQLCSWFSSQRKKLSKGNRFLSMNGAFIKIFWLIVYLYSIRDISEYNENKYVSHFTFSSCHCYLWYYEIIQDEIMRIKIFKGNT